MRKRKAAAIAALALLGSLSPLAAPLRAADSRQGTFEVLYGRLSINDPAFQQVYAKGGRLAGIGLTAALFLNIDFYLEAKVFSKKGRLTFSREATRFVLLPFSVGFRWRAPLGLIEPFVGAGLDYDVFYENNPIGTALDYAKGTHILAGVALKPGRRSPLALSGRIRYSMVKAEHAGISVDLGGLEAGASLAFLF